MRNECNSARHITALGHDMSVLRVRISKERCVFSPVGVNSVRGQSPDSSKRFEVKKVFFDVCPPDCVEILVLCRNWEARFASVSQHFGTVSHV